jgi:tetratricopeptide (TPR) repeat protein
MSLKTVLILFALALAAFSGIALAGDEAASGQETLTVTANAQYELAQKYLDLGEYFKAVAEFERFLHFFGGHPLAPDARIGMAKAYLLGGQYADAVGAFADFLNLHPTDPDVDKARLLLCRAYAEAKDFANALPCLESLAGATSDPLVADIALNQMGWLLLEQGLWDEAKAAFGRVSAKNRLSSGAGQVLDQLELTPMPKTKSPAIAGALAIIPGAGHLYTGRYQDAAVALVLNAGLIFGAIECFDNDMPALGAIVSFVAVGFYAGNIQGAVSSVHKHNARQKEAFLENLRRKARPALHIGMTQNGPTGFVSFVF